MKSSSTDRIIASLLVIVGVLAVLLTLLWFKGGSKDDPIRLAGGSDITHYTTILRQAYGSQPAYGNQYTNEEIYQVLLATDTACTLLRYDKHQEFVAFIMKNRTNRMIATGAVLEKCTDQQEKALDWGVTKADIGLFPTK